MSKSGSAAKIKLNSFDDLFGSTEEKDDNAERIVRVKRSSCSRNCKAQAGRWI